MSDIVRLSVSLERDLVDAFDEYVERGKFPTRSEAVRHLIHDALTKQAWQGQGQAKQVVGTLTLVYEHHRPDLNRKLLRLQHDHGDCVVANLHVHLEHDLCLEVIALRGPAKQLQELASQLRGLKGVHKGELVMASGRAH
jgi:CopG family nickel-responsive transcriptional regulator